METVCGRVGFSWGFLVCFVFSLSSCGKISKEEFRFWHFSIFKWEGGSLAHCHQLSVTGSSTDRGVVLKTRHLLGQNSSELRGVCSLNEGWLLSFFVQRVINDLIQPAVLLISRINKNMGSYTLIVLLEKETMYDKSKENYRQLECANFGKGK